MGWMRMLGNKLTHYLKALRLNRGRYASLFILCALVLLCVCLPHIVYARAGGGGGYGGGGGGGGGGGDGGGLAVLIVYWVQFCIAYPQIGLPVTAVVLVVVIITKRAGHEAYRGNVIYRGGAAFDLNQEVAVVAALRANDPAFDVQAFRDRITAAFIKIQAAWCAQKLETVRPFISDSIHERFSLQLQEQREMSYRDQMDNLRVDKCALAAVVSEGGYDSVDVGISATAKDYQVWLADGTYFQGSRDDNEFTEYWTLLRRHGAQTKSGQAGLFEGHCPNCGAAIAMNQSANCTYCKALLRSGEHDWVLVKITQACEWRPRPVALLPGVLETQRDDPEFNLAYLEDHASVMFWRWLMAWRAGNSAPLQKCASPECCAEFTRQLAAETGNSGRSYYGECAVGSLDTLGIILEETGQRAVVEVRWDGVRYVVGKDGRAQRTERSAIRRTLLVLSRKAGVKSKLLNGVGSAHCPGCGAPQSLTTAAACEYCGAVLNDGSLGWSLAAVHPWSEDEAQALTRQMEAQRGSQVADTGMPHALALLSWLAQHAQAAGGITDDERALFMHAAAQYGVDDGRAQMILAAAERGKLEIAEPDGPEEAKAWLVALTELALEDGKVSSEEWTLLYTLGERQGLVKADVNLLVQKTKLRLYQAARGELKNARANRRQGTAA